VYLSTARRGSGLTCSTLPAPWYLTSHQPEMPLRLWHVAQLEMAWWPKGWSMPGAQTRPPTLRRTWWYVVFTAQALGARSLLPRLFDFRLPCDTASSHSVVKVSVKPRELGKANRPQRRRTLLGFHRYWLGLAGQLEPYWSASWRVASTVVPPPPSTPDKREGRIAASR
jgi:hypothetical protein